MSDDAEIKFKRDVQIAEYKEASTAYFKGIEIGEKFFRMFILVNGILISGLEIQNFIGAREAGAPSVIRMMNLSSVIPIVGIMFSFVFISIIPFLYKQLDRTIERCILIENEIGAGLFKHLGEGWFNESGRISTRKAMKLFGIVAIVFWSYALYMQGQLSRLSNWIQWLTS